MEDTGASSSQQPLSGEEETTEAEGAAQPEPEPAEKPGAPGPAERKEGMEPEVRWHG